MAVDPKWRLRVEFKPQDCWVGVFWKCAGLINQPNHGAIDAFAEQLDVWICVLPMLPLHLTRTRQIGPREAR